MHARASVQKCKTSARCIMHPTPGPCATLLCLLLLHLQSPGGREARPISLRRIEDSGTFCQEVSGAAYICASLDALELQYYSLEESSQLDHNTCFPRPRWGKTLSERVIPCLPSRLSHCVVISREAVPGLPCACGPRIFAPYCCVDRLRLSPSPVSTRLSGSMTAS